MPEPQKNIFDQFDDSTAQPQTQNIFDQFDGEQPLPGSVTIKGKSSTLLSGTIKQIGKNIQSPYSNFAKATSLPTPVKKLAEWLDLPLKSMTGAGIAAGMSLGSAIESAKKGETGTAILEAGLGVGEAGLGMLNVVPGAAPVMQAFNVGGKALEEVSPKGSEVVNYALTPFKSSLDLEVKKGYKPKSWETPAAGLADVAYQFMLFGLFRKKNYTKPQAEAKAKAIASKIAQKKTLSNEERKIVSEFIPKEKADIQAKIDEIQKRLTERPETQPPQPIPEIVGAPEQPKIPILPKPKAPLESVLLDAQGRPIPTERAKLAEQAQAPLTEAERQTIPVDLESIVPTAKTEITAAPIEAPLKVTPKADIIENIRTAMESGEPVKVEPKKAVETPKVEEVTADALANKIIKEPKPVFTDEEIQFYTNNPEAVESALTRLRGEKPQTPVQAEKVSPEASEGAKTPIPEPLPDFTNTESALEFGKANPDRIPELTQRREKNLAESEKLIENNDLDSAMKSAFKAQLDREAIEAAQKLTQKAPIDLATKGKAIPEQVQKPAEAPKETLTGIKEPKSEQERPQKEINQFLVEQLQKAKDIREQVIREENKGMSNEDIKSVYEYNGYDEKTLERLKEAGFEVRGNKYTIRTPEGGEYTQTVGTELKRLSGSSVLNKKDMGLPRISKKPSEYGELIAKAVVNVKSAKEDIKRIESLKTPKIQKPEIESADWLYQYEAGAPKEYYRIVKIKQKNVPSVYRESHQGDPMRTEKFENGEWKTTNDYFYPNGSYGRTRTEPRLYDIEKCMPTSELGSRIIDKNINTEKAQLPKLRESVAKNSEIVKKGGIGTNLLSIASLAISTAPNEVLPFDEETNKKLKVIAGLIGFAGALAMVRGLSPKGMEFFKDVEASAKRSGGGINKWLRSALKSEEAKTLDLADKTKLESVLRGGKLNDIERKVEKIKVKSEEQTPTTETGKEIKPAVKESIPPPTVEVDPELTQIRELVASKKGIVRHQRALYKAERGRRAGMLADVYTEPNGSQTYFKALSRLKGELPKADWGTATDAQLVLREYMHDMVSKSKQSVYDKVDLGRSIEKIFDGESLGKKGYKKLEDFFGKDVVEGLVKQDKWDIVVDLLNVPRTLMSSFDMSMPFRQAAIQTVSHPIKAAKAMKDMHIAAFSEKASKRIYDAIKSRTNNGLYEEFKLDILNFEDPFSRLTNREEAFISKTAQKIKFLGAGVRMAGRAAYTYLNRIRADVFDSYANELKKSGITPENNPETYKALASWVNISTGRGSYGRFNQFAPTASAVLFSPRLLASRFEILNPHAYYTMYKTSPLLAKKAISDAVKFFGATVGLLALAKQSGVADVEFDPRSADFLKMRIGETRIDPLAGFSQIMRFISREVTGQTKTAKGEIVTGEKFPYPTRADIAGRFAESKLNPHIGLLWSWMKGKGYLGEKFDIEQEALNRILPLYLQDVKDAVNEHGLAGGLSITAPGFYGMGVQVYTPRPAKASTTKTKYGGKYESNKKSPKYSGGY